MNTRRAMAAVYCVAVVCVAGCQDHTDLKRKGEFLALGRAYLSYYSSHRACPVGLTDLETEKAKFPGLSKEIEEGQFVVIWNAKLTKDPNENDKSVLGYPKNATETGGLVLMGGGAWEDMSAANFCKTSKLPTEKVK